MSRIFTGAAARRWRVAFGWVGGALLLAGFARLARETPPLLFLAALGPAAACAAVVILLDRHLHARRRLLFGAFLWGAVAAPALAVVLNGAVRAWLGDLGGADAARWTGTFGAPLVEEGSKALALVLLVLMWRDDIAGVADGIVYGALVGIGFTMAENLFYFAAALLGRGPEGLAESIYLRAALGGLTHAIFTASSGAGVGWARDRRTTVARLGGPALGFALAVTQHVAWNAWGAQRLDFALCAPGGSQPCLLSGRLWYWLVTAPPIVFLFLGPGLAALALLVRGHRKRLSPGMSAGEHG